MYQEDFYNPSDPNDYDEPFESAFEKAKRIDRGYNVVLRRFQRKDGTWKNKKVEVYTSGGIGTRIRDAESGQYYTNLVGSNDEDLFFKVALATGECRSANGSNTLFYLSPQHYASHQNCNVDQSTIDRWEQKRNLRLKESKASSDDSQLTTMDDLQFSNRQSSVSYRSWADVLK
jgi:hypothetical protein